MDKRYSIIHLRRVTLAANYCFAIRGKQVFTNCYKINKCAAAVKTTLKMMIALAIVHSIGAVQGDAVKQLPGWSNALPSAMYSGK